MSDDFVQRTLRIDPDLFEAVEKEATARGQKFPAFVTSALKNEVDRSDKDSEPSYGALEEMLTSKSNTGFGDETLLEEINRRVAFLQGLTMHLIADSSSDDRARLIARSTKDEMNGQEWRRKMIEANA